MRPIKLSDCSARLRARLEDALARSEGAEQERDGQTVPSEEGDAFPPLVHVTGKVLVRITRRYSGRLYDDDNMSGGSKALRDALASALGRKGDSLADGMVWVYEQEHWPQDETLIEVFNEPEKAV